MNTTGQPEQPEALVHCDGRWFRFSKPKRWIACAALEGVPAALDQVERAVERGAFAVGYLSYEAAPAFDEAFETHPAAPALPTLGFALFDAWDEIVLPPDESPAGWHSTTNETREHYDQAIAAVKQRIAAGEVYQVNHTFPVLLSPEHALDPASAQTTAHETALSSISPPGLALLRRLCQAQGSTYACWLRRGELDIVSASPELFFELHDGRIVTKPMKGTAPRGRTLEEDREIAGALRSSNKDRAENLMIVDMMRNDLGRIAKPGSVSVERMFDVERLPTLHQMTSTITAETTASLAEVFGALFPCASITGAPKVTAMRAIKNLEEAPRGVYTGAVGVVLPAHPSRLGTPSDELALEGSDSTPRVEQGPRVPFARFNVAIRTAWRTGPSAPFRYGVGSGVVWDSSAAQEFAECHSKAQALTQPRPHMHLLETMRVRPIHGPWDSHEQPLRRIWLLREHLDRLCASAEYFDIPICEGHVRGQLADFLRSSDATPGPQRLRLRVDRRGTVDCELSPLPIQVRGLWNVALSPEPVDAEDPFLFHKTTQRAVYERALASARKQHPEIDDVILWNARGELTESSVANLLLPAPTNQRRWLTPPRSAGLLAGTLRARLLARNRIVERTLEVGELQVGKEFLLINSVRGVVRARCVANHRASARRRSK